MSNLSQFRSQAAGPIGSTMLVEYGPSFKPSDVLNFGPYQYVRSGVLVPYSSAYSQAIVDCPQIRVTGTYQTGQNLTNVDSPATFRQQVAGTPTIVLYGSATAVYTSTDRVTWTSAGSITGSIPNSNNVKRCVTWNGTRGVGVNSSTPTQMSYSSSSTLVGAWTVAANVAGGNISYHFWDGSRFVAMPAAGVASSGAVNYLTSTDGTAWTVRTAVTLAGFDTTSVFGFGGGGASYIVGSTGKIAKSTDGIAWTLKGTLTATPVTFLDAVVIGTKLIVAYRTSTAVVLDVSTDDGVTWTNKISQTYGVNGTAGAYLDPATGNGYLIVAGSTSSSPAVVYESSDNGITWNITRQMLQPVTGAVSGTTGLYVDQTGWAFVRSVSTASYAMEGQWSRTDWVGSQNGAYQYAPASGSPPILYSYVRTK